MSLSIKHVVSVSGGKDSTATWLLAREKFGDDVIAAFADTGHEHPITLEYLDYLETALGPVHRVKADFSRQIEFRRQQLLRAAAGEIEYGQGRKWSREQAARAVKVMHPTGIPFLDLCLVKGRFPASQSRFCSEQLKHVPLRRLVVDPLLDGGSTVVSWQGIRRDESVSRAAADPISEEDSDLWVYRPILDWTAADVFDFHRRYGIRWNPLYEQGMGRVGCMPCIMCRKDELAEIARRWPEEIARVREWERIISSASKRGLLSLFSTDKTTRDYDSATVIGIDQVVEWSQTGRGGKQIDFLRQEEPAEECSSIYGLCE